MKRSNTWQDAMTTGTALLDMGDGITIPLPVDGVFPGEPGPPGPGVPEGGTALQVVRKNAAGTTTEWATPDKAMVGLGNVNNTADSDKPVSEATQDALDALSASTLTGLAGKVDKDSSGLLADLPSGGDDTAALNAKFAAGAGKAVTLRPGATYIVTDTLVLPSRTLLDLNGATLDFTTMPVATAQGQRKALTVTGALGSALPVSTAITQWSTTVSGISSTAGLVAGDLVLLSNDERPVPGLTRTDRDKGELNIIRSVDSGTQVTLTTGAVFAYGTTGLQLQKITPAENVLIRGGRIQMAGIGSGHNGIEVQYAKNCAARDVTIDGAEDIALNFRSVYNGKAINNTISGSTSNATLGNTGYGVSIVEGSRHILAQGNQFYNCRHFVAGGGYWPPVFVDVKDNHGERSSAAGYDCHESTFYWKFHNNTAAGCALGMVIRGQYISVDGNQIVNSAGRTVQVATFDGVTEQRGISVTNTRGTNNVYGIEIDGQAAGAEPNCRKYDVTVSGNILTSCGSSPILLRNFENADVSGNEIYGSTSHAILILGLSGLQSSQLNMVGNNVRNAGGDSVKVQYVDDVQISGGVLNVAAQTGLELLNGARIACNGATVRAATFNGIFANAVTTLSLTGVSSSGMVGASYDALRVTGSSNVTVNGGYYQSARNAIYTTTTDYVIVQGVNGRDAASGTKINVDATTKAVANNLV